MIDWRDFWNRLAEAVGWLMVVILVALLWILAVTTLQAQSVPLVRVPHDAFVCYYDIQTHNPSLVCYVLEHRHFSGSNKVKGRHFKSDTKLPRPRVKDGDYTNSGFVRGHLCSAGDRDSDKAWLKETYLTSNLVPMTMVCNSGAWKVIEDSCRLLASQGHRLQICRGPLYRDIPEASIHVLQNRLAIRIPEGFFSFARCLDCPLVYCRTCYNSSSQGLEGVIRTARNDVTQSLRYYRDPRVSQLLTNILGLWSREEYETITH